jgi:hypothetical protein
LTPSSDLQKEQDVRRRPGVPQHHHCRGHGRVQ